MDKKTINLLKYIHSSPYRSYDEIEAFCGIPLEYSEEYQLIFNKKLIYISNGIFCPHAKSDCFSLTPQGREIIEQNSVMRRRDFIAYATFILALLNFLFYLLKNL